MANLKRTQYTLIIIVVVFFVVSVILTLFAGIPLKVAIIDNVLDSLQVSYNLIQFSLASTPLILFSKLLDAAIFPILTVILASWFFDFIANINLRERMSLSRINRLEKHVIVVPYNSFAQSLLQEFRKSGIKTVTIVENKKDLAKLYREDELAVVGDIRSVETFEIAGIEKARCVVACAKEDIHNALISITAKTANPHVKIISRANKEENLTRLVSAGAHELVMAENTAGKDMGDEIAKRVLLKKTLKTN